MPGGPVSRPFPSIFYPNWVVFHRNGATTLHLLSPRPSRGPRESTSAPLRKVTSPPPPPARRSPARAVPRVPERRGPIPVIRVMPVVPVVPAPPARRAAQATAARSTRLMAAMAGTGTGRGRRRHFPPRGEAGSLHLGKGQSLPSAPGAPGGHGGEAAREPSWKRAEPSLCSMCSGRAGSEAGQVPSWKRASPAPCPRRCGRARGDGGGRGHGGSGPEPHGRAPAVPGSAGTPRVRTALGELGLWHEGRARFPGGRGAFGGRRVSVCPGVRLSWLRQPEGCRVVRGCKQRVRAARRFPVPVESCSHCAGASSMSGVCAFPCVHSFCH